MILIQFSKPLGWGRRKGKKTFRLAETERIARPLTHRVPLHLMPFFKNSLASSNLGGNCSLLKSAKSFYHDEVFAHAFLKASSYATNAKWSARGRHYGTTSPFKTPRKPGKHQVDAVSGEKSVQQHWASADLFGTQLLFFLAKAAKHW